MEEEDLEVDVVGRSSEVPSRGELVMALAGTSQGLLWHAPKAKATPRSELDLVPREGHDNDLVFWVSALHAP